MTIKTGLPARLQHSPLCRNILFLVTFLYALKPGVMAQEHGSAGNMARLSVFSPGFSFEAGVTATQTIYAHAFMATTAGIGWSSSLGTRSTFHFDPAVNLQYRYYYNFSRRHSKGRSTRYNNGNFFHSVQQWYIQKTGLHPETTL